MLTVIVFLLVFIIVLPAIIVIPQAFTSLNYFTYPIPEFSDVNACGKIIQ